MELQDDFRGTQWNNIRMVPNSSQSTEHFSHTATRPLLRRARGVRVARLVPWTAAAAAANQPEIYIQMRTSIHEEIGFLFHSTEWISCRQTVLYHLPALICSSEHQVLFLLLFHYANAPTISISAPTFKQRPPRLFATFSSPVLICTWKAVTCERSAEGTGLSLVSTSRGKICTTMAAAPPLTNTPSPPLRRFFFLEIGTVNIIHSPCSGLKSQTSILSNSSLQRFYSDHRLLLTFKLQLNCFLFV